MTQCTQEVTSGPLRVHGVGDTLMYKSRANSRITGGADSVARLSALKHFSFRASKRRVPRGRQGHS
jgi:hypothetical protein